MGAWLLTTQLSGDANYVSVPVLRQRCAEALGARLGVELSPEQMRVYDSGYVVGRSAPDAPGRTNRLAFTLDSGGAYLRGTCTSKPPGVRLRTSR